MLDWLETVGAWIAQAPRAWLAAGFGGAVLAALSRRRAGPVALALLGLAVASGVAEWLWRAGGDAHPVAKALAGLFACVALGAGAGMAAARSPVYAALAFAVAVLGVAGAFMLLGAAFVAAATVIVYAGAIIVTFVFVIMLAQTQRLSGYDLAPWNPVPAALGAAAFAGVALTVSQRSFEPAVAPLLVQRLVRIDIELAGRPGDAPLAREPLVEGLAVEAAVQLALDRVPDPAARAALTPSFAAAARTWRRLWTSEAAPSSTAALLAFRELAAAAANASTYSRRDAEWLPALVPAALDMTAWREHRSPLATPSLADDGHLSALGRTLWGDYLMGVEIAGTLLLLAAVGAIALNQSPREPRA